jgi:hypothetical protein
MALPTRTQQIGWFVALALLVLWALSYILRQA